jgi:alkaline phosphatase D
MDSAQVGEGFSQDNYGAIGIDWAAGSVDLEIKNAAGETVRQTTAQFR